MDLNYITQLKVQIEQGLVNQIEEKLGNYDPQDFEFIYAISLQLKKEKKFEEAIDLLTIASKQYRDDLSLFLTISEKAIMYMKLQDFEKSNTCFQQSESLLQRIDYAQRKEIGEIEADFFRNFGVLKITRGEFDLGRAYHLKSLDLEEKENNQKGIASIHNNLGVIEINQGNPIGALNHFSISTDLFSQIGDSKSEAVIFNNMGAISQKIGKFDNAVDYYSSSLILSRKNNDLALEAKSLNNLGNVYLLRQEFDKANAYYHLSLKIKIILDDKVGMYASYHNLGKIARLEKRFEDSISFLNKALECQNSKNNSLEIANTYHELIQTYLEISAKDQALNFFSKLSDLYNSTTNPEITLYYKLTKAILIKNSDFSIYRLSALRILYDIIESPVINYEITINSILHYLDIKLNEYSRWHIEFNINHIDQLTDELYQLSKQNNDLIYTVHSLIVKAKIALVKSNPELMEKYISNAQRVANDNELQILVPVVTKEKQFLFELYEKCNTGAIDPKIANECISKSSLTTYFKTLVN